MHARRSNKDISWQQEIVEPVDLREEEMSEDQGYHDYLRSQNLRRDLEEVVADLTEFEYKIRFDPEAGTWVETLTRITKIKESVR